MKYSLKDVTIVPAVISDIESRSECNPFYEGEKLPLFTSPMSTVVDDKMYGEYIGQGITPIIPRNIDINKRVDLMFNKRLWCAFSIKEVEDLFLIGVGEDYNPYPTLTEDNPIYLCIDVANGHMKKLLDIIESIKNKYGEKCIVMAGNIANPDTYLEYAKVGCDYVRLSIGTGSQCTSSANAAIHYPMGSLIGECYQRKLKVIKSIESFTNPTERCRISQQYKSIPKIIADGGISNFDDIIKALALGADYVMCGKIFAKAWESASEPLFTEKYYNTERFISSLVRDETDPKQINELLNDDMNPNNLIKNVGVYKNYYGMSTKTAQKEFGNEILKTSEGIHSVVKVDYTLGQWTENLIHYMRSAMSYTNSKTLKGLIGKVNTIQITTGAYTSYFK